MKVICIELPPAGTARTAEGLPRYGYRKLLFNQAITLFLLSVVNSSCLWTVSWVSVSSNQLFPAARDPSVARTYPSRSRALSVGVYSGLKFTRKIQPPPAVRKTPPESALDLDGTYG